ncbi:Uncharacterized membrane protein [Desulfacinum infernum DSM 9756]|uniref:Uncharacterized membrane protein n=1 Tax=Desulfacinum infernum DSM 9756 TaxID=1121391 RepID=A0A1M5FV27_9BACT|nr:DUF2177 family protein [Desulfacinum infernum]SHF95279.1 Uncharacterized membrane protein [Desulfacinum infernum DSM 9756]
MGHNLKLYVGTVVIFLAIDLTYLGLIMPKFYKAQLGALARLRGDALAPLWWAAFVVYLLIPAGILLFALPRVNPANPFFSALAWGFLYGVTLYGVYDFTNLSTLDKWPVALSFADTAWGGVLCSLVTAAAYRLDRWIG